MRIMVAGEVRVTDIVSDGDDDSGGVDADRLSQHERALSVESAIRRAVDEDIGGAPGEALATILCLRPGTVGRTLEDRRRVAAATTLDRLAEVLDAAGRLPEASARTADGDRSTVGKRAARAPRTSARACANCAAAAFSD